jgi:hypothetical protein
MKIPGQRLHAQPEDTGNFFQFEAEEIFHLRAGDEDGNAVGKADDDGTRNVLYRGAHAGQAHDDENDAGHHRAHEQAVDAVRGDDAGDDDHEGSGGAADLGGRSAERGDQKAGHYGAIDSGLRREAGGDGEGHGERQSDQAYGDSGDQSWTNLFGL